ncbi:MAG: hypothetical protein EZS28_014778 [Streblomastix strix]|uniref:Uncharacterized protein n=1 Tax=Streblomastix strix TaxID=222440 RepID=A0A5J4W4R9_9EUKA|nr:MAG: hypothetical protein EZS28_014778 [Streblomastix strix]
MVNFLSTLRAVWSAHFQLTEFVVDYVAFAIPNHASVKVAVNLGGFYCFLPCLMEIITAEANFDVDYVVCIETWLSFEIWQNVKKVRIIKNN